MWTDVQFWKDTTWRAFRSFCQSLAALLTGQTLNLLTAPWSSMLSVAATAGLASLLMSIDRGRAVTEAGPPALAGTPKPTEPEPAVACGDALR